ncbi:acid-sensing system DNA-binding response regulator EvgA [Serratia rubidaea]|uniref:acid-sensing system DNA-binding response regulator EvgA n=1 Tax=Serratia rubidaea TaxID=61652 RepID=UPI001785D11E|nr:acid-sensing system DNA-binding response regulator EvgA [Serratia rubidaea]MBD8453646.1 acid-sensing system DNA-binding response regulator EvgA [Serratia rubidaea]
MASVIIVDDHPLARMAIKFVIENEGHTLLAETGDGTETLTLVDKYYPDILILDIDINGMNGIEVIKKLRAASYPGIIIIVSAKNPEFYAQRGIEAGANGFISKKNDLNNIVAAINAAMSGYGYFPMNKNVSALNAYQEDKDKLLTLSQQEFQVFRYLIRGMENVRIAGKMNISNKTVSTYKTRLMEKIGCKTQLELFEFARRNNLE